MTDSDMADKIYAPPLSELRDAPVKYSKSIRFWITCFVSAICLIVLLAFSLDFVLQALPDFALIGITFLVWLIPVFWILWPEIKLDRGLRKLTYGRLAKIAVGVLFSTLSIAMAIVVLVGVGLALLDGSHSGT